jgi:hypothetical protein
MSRTTDDDTPLDVATLRALGERDGFLPTTETEVGRAEATLPDDLELPEGLRSYRPRGETGKVVPLERKRRPLLTHSLAVAAGGLAAAAAFALLTPPPAPTVTSAGGELVRPSASAKSLRVPLVYESRCARECCAGADCKTASENMRACPSGVRCAGCAPDNVGGGPYRLRVGSVILTDVGRSLTSSEGPLDVCVRASASDTPCLPATGEPGGETWRSLKVVSPLQDLLTGLSVELRRHGDAVALAGWRRPVSPTADVLCKGLAVQLGNEKETWARLSIFVEPTHFVELSRAAAVPDLLGRLNRFDVSGIEPRIFALRWQLLDHGVDTRVGHGLDFVGAARPTR